MSTDNPPRDELRSRGIDAATFPKDPMAAFAEWRELYRRTDPIEPDAAVLATADRSGAPSARVVLVRGADAAGFVFFTNYESRKGRELAENPRGALAFFFESLGRQVRVCGAVTKVARAETDAYFAARPRASQIGAWASAQSSVVRDRAALDARLDEVERKFAGKPVPAPPHWGGYRLAPAEIEFWQARDGRMHDRLLFTRDARGWKLERLAP